MASVCADDAPRTLPLADPNPSPLHTGTCSSRNRRWHRHLTWLSHRLNPASGRYAAAPAAHLLKVEYKRLVFCCCNTAPPRRHRPARTRSILRAGPTHCPVLPGDSRSMWNMPAAFPDVLAFCPALPPFTRTDGAGACWHVSPPSAPPVRRLAFSDLHATRHKSLSDLMFWRWPPRHTPSGAPTGFNPDTRHLHAPLARGQARMTRSGEQSADGAQAPPRSCAPLGRAGDRSGRWRADPRRVRCAAVRSVSDTPYDPSADTQGGGRTMVRSLLAACPFACRRGKARIAFGTGPG